VRYALGVVEPVDAQQQAPARVFVAYVLVGFHGVGGLGKACELVHVDADGEGLDLHRGAKGAQALGSHLFGAALAAHVAREVRHVGLALQSHQVIGEQRTHQPLVLRYRRHDQRRRHGDVQEETNALAAAHGTQLCGQRDQVVVMHPDDVVIAQER